MKRVISVLAAMAFVSLAAPAHAQATRTWVSGVGDDVNPCSRTAPCKTFAGAISKTAAGGEINCLDPGGFGAVTITKSMTIACQYTEGGALAGGNGIVINDSLTATPGTIVVHIKGLDIFGVNPPTHGIRFVSGSTLIVEDSQIRRFNAANSWGISFQPSGTSKMVVMRTSISANGSGATGGGILIQPTGAAGNARVVIDDVSVMHNANDAIRIDRTGNSSGTPVLVDITRSRLLGSSNGVSVITPVGTALAAANVVDSTVSGNTSAGLRVNGASSLIRADGNLISHNAVGMSINGGGSIFGYGTNVTDGNDNPSTFSAGSPLGRN